MSVLQPVVPILSLPSAVLFPHALLDLRLSGPQFDRTAGEWLADGAIWGIATLRTNSSPSFELKDGRVFRTLGIGRIVYRERENGLLRRIVLEGLVRGRIKSDFTTAPATVHVEILRDHVNIEGNNRKDLAQVFSEMVRAARRLAALDPEKRNSIRRVLAAHPHPGVVADLLAHHCINDIYAKQSILDELDVCRRAHLVRIILSRMVTQQSPLPLRRFGR